MQININQTQIELVQADITAQKVDAIVNAANSSLAGGGGVDGAIHRRGGPEIMRETGEKYPSGCPSGSAVATGAGNLHAKFVFHAVGPRWSGGNRNEPELLQSAYRRCLELAVEHGCNSIAFPSISTGVYGFPVELAAPIAIQTVIDFLNENKTEFKIVRFCLFSNADLATYTKTLLKNELAELLVSLGEVVIGEKTITIERYPFEPSIAYRHRVFDSHEIANVDPDSWPPTIQIGNELISIPSLQKEELARFAENNAIPNVRRPDIWSWILEPFLDTEFTEENNERFNGFLAEYGFSEQEINSLREEVKAQMIKYNFDTMLWDWTHLGLDDVLRAMRTKYNKNEFELFFRKAMAIALSEKCGLGKENC